MNSLLNSSVLAAAASSFLVVKGIFQYLSFLLQEKDETLKHRLERIFVYLSEHSYFDVMKSALSLSHARLISVFLSWRRFFLLGLSLALLNSLILISGKWMGFDGAIFHRDLSHLLAHDQVTMLPEFWSTEVALSDLLRRELRPGDVALATIEHTLIGLYGFLFVMSLLWVASKSRGWLELLVQFCADIGTLLTLFIADLALVYCWLLPSFYQSAAASIAVSFVVGMVFYAMYPVLRYWQYPGARRSFRTDPLLRAFLALGVPLIPSAAIYLLSQRSLPVIFAEPLNLLLALALAPVVVTCGFRVFWMQPTNVLERSAKTLLTAGFLFVVVSTLFEAIVNWETLPSLILRLSDLGAGSFFSLLIVSSGLPIFAHLLAVLLAVAGKLTPRLLQNFFNYHIKMLARDEDKILSRLGDTFGGLSAILAAILTLR